MAPPSSSAVADVAVFGKVEIADTEVERLSSVALLERLVAGGVSRLTAQRIVEIQSSTTEPGRARPHTTSRR